MAGDNKFLIPGSILVAGLLIAGVFLIAGRDTETPRTPNGEDTSVRPVSAQDRILGNPEASIKIVEFSDIDCPFCADFHITMHTIMEEYGPSGQVAWVYRHFPIAQLHPQAKLKAEASECAGDLGGTDAFWRYLDILYERETTRADLAPIAEEIGLNRSQFESCLSENRFTGKVEDDIREAQRIGVRGTPHSVIVIEETGEEIPLPGAQPYSAVKQVIELLLADLEH